MPRPMAVSFTKAQEQSIRTIDENLQIIACAGSGKTEVVSQRVVEILRDKAGAGIEPRNIVAFTFTDKAGAELKDRIVRGVREGLGEVRGMAEMYVGTIHGYCLQLLQTFLPKYFKYSVLNEVQTRLLVDRASTKTGLSDLGLLRWRESRLYLDVLNTLREADVATDGLSQSAAPAALAKYQAYLDEKRYLDFGEIMVRAVEELETNAAVIAAVAAQTRYLIVDEYQDVNPLQERLIRRLNALGANVCVVGDDDQTIYQWRGSSVENILHFSERYPAVTAVTMEDNFRSSSGVVDGAARVIANNPERLAKVMRSASPQTFDYGDVLCRTFASTDEEAESVAEKVESVIGAPFVDRPGGQARGLSYSDVAVLLRSVRKNGDPIVGALRRHGMPVVVVGMTGLFGTAEVEAAVVTYEFMAERASADQLRRAWLLADVGADEARLNLAISRLKKLRTWREKRFSTYNLQRTFLTLLEDLGLTEDVVPGGRGEIVFYNLGKFSQVISDFEQIHFHSEPRQKYQSFVEFLRRQAPDYYPEGWQDAGYVRPDAVQIMTVHQAKGREWPVVFVPCLQKNRFPSKRHGGKNKWHVIPRSAIRNASSYDGSVEDERRLFYVALTRSKKFLFCSYAPDAGSQLYRNPSVFLSELTDCAKVLTKEPEREQAAKLPPEPRREVGNLSLSLSELKYLLQCPYQFKLRFLYGFNPPLHEALGYGKSLHDALAEVHKRALAGDLARDDEIEELIDRHLNLPFAYPQLRDQLRDAGIDALGRYLSGNREALQNTEYVEQIIEVNLGDGVVVSGRIDLIRRLDTDEVIVVDFKSTERAQAEDVSRIQLHVYAVGYRELTGDGVDLVEIHNLDKGGSIRELVDERLEQATQSLIQEAATELRSGSLARKPSMSMSCEDCDLAGLCSGRASAG